jgi:putative ABC transport system permease protein
VVSGNAQVKFLNRNSRVQVQGVAVPYLALRNFVVETGRPLSEAECEGGARVAVLGPTTATNLFDAGEAVGETIKVNGQAFRVVGVLRSKGDQGWYNPDDLVLIPYSTAMKSLFGLNRLREINVSGEIGGDLAALQTAITAVLRRRHQLSADAEDDGKQPRRRAEHRCRRRAGRMQHGARRWAQSDRLCR